MLLVDLGGHIGPTMSLAKGRIKPYATGIRRHNKPFHTEPRAARFREINVVRRGPVIGDVELKRIAFVWMGMSEFLLLPCRIGVGFLPTHADHSVSFHRFSCMPRSLVLRQFSLQVLQR